LDETRYWDVVIVLERIHELSGLLGVMRDERDRGYGGVLLARRGTTGGMIMRSRAAGKK